MPAIDTPPPLRVGVVGLGWAGQQHLDAYRAIPGVEVIALAGQEEDLLRRLAEEHDVEHRLSDYRDLLEVPGLDAVSIAVPTFLHAPIALAALERGLHVLCEKPIARTAEEGQSMVEAARRAGRVLEIAFNHRLRGDVRALAERVSAGQIGRPYYGRASWQRRRGIPQLGSWFTNHDMSGGGPLIDLGVHVLDYALHILGEPRVRSVTASTFAELGPRGLGGTPRNPEDRSAHPYEVEDFASAFLRLEDGGTLIVEAGWAAYREETDLLDFSAFGTEGGARLHVAGASENPCGDLTIYRDVEGEVADEAVETIPGPAHQGVVEAFVEHVRDPACWAEHDGSLALSRASIIDACYRSAAEKKEVELS
ncbi:Gfo/Idh/MocA family protein [Rothia halotolerans]|uniref:Gfo/Idh/MocA family protein n=1 Tax=Rothia halotolerans TaxID=405770 RepID=UPI00101B6E0E|nr:Gfo/Idh/MocA family oxidoreductase [Rothia halotolerans]